VHPGAERNVLALAEILRDETDVLDGLVDQELSGRAEIELDKLQGLPPALRRLVVQRLADVRRRRARARGRAPRGRRSRPSKSPGALDIGSGVRAVVERRTVRFERLHP